MKLLFVLTGSLVFGCSAPAEKSREELHELFAGYMTKTYNDLGTGEHLVFIVGKTDCSPCIEAVETSIAANYRQTDKRAVVFDSQLLTIPNDVQKVSGNAREIAKYGLLSGDGNACIFQNGKLTLVEPINVANPEQLIAKLQSHLR